MKKIQLCIALSALALAAVIFASDNWLTAVLLLTLTGCTLNQPRARLCVVTLSVPEILKDILEAFKVGTPELFGPAGFAQDFTSDTAVLGDRITAHISHVPTTQAYDNTPGPGHGFYGGAQDVITLIEDVPVTLNQLRHVPVKIGFLTGLATKGVPLYKAGVSEIGYTLGKYVIDNVLASAGSSVSNSIVMPPLLSDIDSWEGTRNQCNAQKMVNKTRWAFIGSALARALGADDRVRSELFYGQLNGDQGYRRWKNVAGFSWIREYPDIVNAGGNIGGIAGDHRLAAVSVRKIRDMTQTAKALGLREVMKFDSLRDEGSGLELCGISWQEAGSGDLYLSAAVLFGTGVGNQGGAAGSMTDNAGLLIKTQ
ncbi:MAG TPA: hypothetical protein VN578_06345 [Candidatus Binatia bacterium]|jgi:hypothetical protein|nr:hypothetical protein [Candidatus Binatia bacterium]